MEKMRKDTEYRSRREVMLLRKKVAKFEREEEDRERRMCERYRQLQVEDERRKRARIEEEREKVREEIRQKRRELN